MSHLALAVDEDFNDYFCMTNIPKSWKSLFGKGGDRWHTAMGCFTGILLFSHQWTQLKIRKQNLTRLFEKMQAYQYEQISADPDKPLADGIRALDTTDMER